MTSPEATTNTEGKNTMYRFDIQHHANGTMTVTCDDCSAPSERVLARMMVELGMADGPVEAGRDGRVDWMVASLHRFAAVALSEGDKGFSFPPYAPYPPRDLHPALDRAISALRRDRKTAAEARAARVVAGKAEKALVATL